MVRILASGLDLGEHPCERRPKNIRLLTKRECLSQRRAGYKFHSTETRAGQPQKHGRDPGGWRRSRRRRPRFSGLGPEASLQSAKPPKALGQIGRRRITVKFREVCRSRRIGQRRTEREVASLGSLLSDTPSLSTR